MAKVIGKGKEKRENLAFALSPQPSAFTFSLTVL
jgi:hypothetical protein